MELKPFTKLAYKRWTEEEEEVLRDLFVEGREKNIPHKQLWEEISNRLERSPTEVQRKLIRMYKSNPELHKLKQESWSKEKILDKLKELYLNNEPINKNSLPDKLKFILLKVTPPSAPEHRCFFPSVDSALAQAVLSTGYCRNEDGSLDQDSPLRSIEDALDYIRLGHKKRHAWTLDEVKNILTALNASDYPITLPFLTNHHAIYKGALGVNRKLESFKDVVKKFVEDGSIKSYSDLVCTIAPEYIAYYNPDKSRLKLSTEEIRVKKFLDRYKIPYVIPKLSDKIPTGLETFANFVPDFIILNDKGEARAIVEVFGSIGDRENSGVNESYADKTRAKLDFYKGLENLGFIEIYNNGGRCDLDDDNLFSRFGSFIKVAQVETEIWEKPNLKDEIEEIERTANELSIPKEKIAQALNNGELASVDSEFLNNLQNSDYASIEDLMDVAKYSKEYKKDPSNIISALKKKETLPAPIVLDIDGRPYLISGNTRLMVSKALGIPVDIWMAKLDFDVQDLITSSIDEAIDNLEKYGCSIIYSNKKYRLISKATQDLSFDSLFQIPLLTPQNPALKQVIRRILEKQRKDKYFHDHKSPGEQQKDYQPRSKPIEYDTDLSTSIPENSSGSGVVG